MNLNLVYVKMLITAFLIIPSSIHSVSAQSKTKKVYTTHLTDSIKSTSGFSPLWDGKTTNGWRGLKSKTFMDKGWEIKDGVLSLKSTPMGASRGGDIVTEKEYSAFELRFEFKISEGGNSGIKYLVESGKDNAISNIGLEYQILDNEKHPDAKKGINGNRTLGSLYDLITSKKIQAAKKPIGEWNKGILKVFHSNRVEHWLNGYKVVEYKRGSAEFLALVAESKYKDRANFGMAKQGRILLQDHGDDVSFRNIEIKELN